MKTLRYKLTLKHKGKAYGEIMRTVSNRKACRDWVVTMSSNDIIAEAIDIKTGKVIYTSN